MGLSIVGAVNLLMTFIIAQAFLRMLRAVKYGLFFVFAGMVLVMTAYVGFLVPETREVPIEEMQREYREPWFWKRYVIGEENDQAAPSSPAKGTGRFHLNPNC